MYFSEIVDLWNHTDTVDTYTTHTDNSTDESVKKSVWANKKSVGRTEFYQAREAGIRIDLIFQVHSEDYDNEKNLDYNEVTYNIIRAYQLGEGIYELSCAVREVVV